MAPPTFSDCVPQDCHDYIRRAVEYWLSIHPETGLPGRQHFDPVDIPSLLPYLRLLDVTREPPRFRIRLMGTRVVHFYEKDFTGWWYDEAFPNFAGSDAEKSMIAAVRTGRPEYRNGPPSFFFPRDYKIVERVALPLARDRQNVDMLFIVHSYD